LTSYLFEFMVLKNKDWTFTFIK